jgi:hypothetical protein
MRSGTGRLHKLKDPRDVVHRKNPVVSVVVIALLVVLAGASGPTAIARWAALKAEFLTRLLPMPSGIPRKDVCRRVLTLQQPTAFQACFANWFRSLRGQAAEATGVGRPYSRWSERWRGTVTTAARA